MAKEINKKSPGANTSVTPGNIANLPATMQGNATADKDGPIMGGDPQLVIQQMQVTQVVRTKQDMLTWRRALIAADSVYNPNRTRLYDMYHDVVLDGHLAGIMQKRIDTVINKQVFYYDKDGSPVTEMQPYIRSNEFRKIMSWIMDTIFWGITGMEFVPGPQLRVRLIDRKHIKPKTQTIAIYQNDAEGGIDYTRLDNIWVLGDADNLGLLLKCAPYAIYKRNAIADWSNFVEVFGMPIRVIRYDPTDAITEAELRKTLTDSGNMTSLMIPRSAEYEIMDGKSTNANGDLQAQFKDSMNQELSIIILGNTETTTGNNTGSQAKSKVHQQQQNEIAKSDIIYMDAMLNEPHFIKILESYGWPVVEGGYFEVKRELDITFLSERIHIDKGLKELGLPLDEDELYATYDAAKPRKLIS